MNRIKELRAKKNWKQADLANALSVAQNTVSNWETGRSEPDLEMVKKIAMVFGCTVDYILEKDVADTVSQWSNDVKKTAAPAERQFTETDISLYEILRKADPDLKKAMLAMLEQSQK